MRVIDLSGEQFGQLTVLARAESNRDLITPEQFDLLYGAWKEVIHDE